MPIAADNPLLDILLMMLVLFAGRGKRSVGANHGPAKEIEKATRLRKSRAISHPALEPIKAKALA